MWGGRQATVGAGLPVIATLKHLVDTGDRILRVEGVFSGTLSFIFNSLAPGRAFSEVVREARTPRNFFACHSVVTYFRLVLYQGAPSAGRRHLGAVLWEMLLDFQAEPHRLICMQGSGCLLICLPVCLAGTSGMSLSSQRSATVHMKGLHSSLLHTVLLPQVSI